MNRRNVRHEADPNSICFAEDDLIRYRARFVPPRPDEPHIVHDGDPESVLKVLEGAARIQDSVRLETAAATQWKSPHRREPGTHVRVISADSIVAPRPAPNQACTS
ncbi:hypothetical protein [Streptomyces sp. NBC_01718]|uniref:hypothetical protein n=1 Tax=Streptomyces sp. NBC_01718 TaxID=2975919 RepID=UPI00352C6D3A